MCPFISHSGRRCCYWSSTGSTSPDSNEYIMGMTQPVSSILVAFTITPYSPAWQPSAPTYAPASVSLQIYLPSQGDGCAPYYQSPQYVCRNIFEDQLFLLPEPLLLPPSCRFKLLLMGKQQRQTIPGMDDYYTCLSHISILGIPLKKYAFTPVKPGGDDADLNGEISSRSNLPDDIGKQNHSSCVTLL